jgi:acetyltransferase-like isoleucine patch superfamily enzyme
MLFFMKSINKLLLAVRTWTYKYKIWRIKLDPRITLGNDVRISKSSIIEIRCGGTISIDDNTEILDGVLILSYGGHIKIGRNCSINPYTIIYGHGGTIIGDNVLIAGHCMIIPNNHNFLEKDKTIIQQGCSAKGIAIESDVWIGHGCSILDGTKISKGTVVAAGSVVNQDTSEYSIVAGVPAKKINSRE